MYNDCNNHFKVIAVFGKRNIVRKYIRFYGWVQAVGFRWRAVKAAEMYGATGWVRNEYDDSVSMEIQGAEKQIDDVIAAIQRGSYIRIDRMEVKEIAPDPDERGFRVKYY